MDAPESKLSAPADEPQSSVLEGWLLKQRTDEERRRRAAEVLLQLVAIDTTPRADLALLREAEEEVFDIIESRLAACSPDLLAERVPIDPRIADHPYYTQPFYAARREGAPLDIAHAVYRDRCNLFVRLPAPGRPRLVLNAHVDVVAPYFPGRIDGDTVFGRGSADDKGPIAAILMAVEWVCEAQTQLNLKLGCELLLQFVIDEETGGNGSLSAAIDHRRSACDAMVVLECTGLGIHPGNRGVVWYSIRLENGDAASFIDSTPAVGHRDKTSCVPVSHNPVSHNLRFDGGESLTPSHLLELSAHAVGALEDCGRRIKAESDHPLFPHRPVQTCHGILGPFGLHPSRVQDHVALDLSWNGALGESVLDIVRQSLMGYCRQYGDKTQPGVGDALLDEHLRWSPSDERHALLELFGLSGHMGSVARLDGAITKAAWIIRDLVAARRKLGNDWAALKIALQKTGGDQRQPLALEGGQGFLPTHKLEDVAARMRQAVEDAVQTYLAAEGLSGDALRWHMTFEKLHNDAFARPADGPVVQALADSARRAGITVPQVLLGWDVSCDARIFAREFPQTEVITFGPGKLSLAHSNNEHIEVNDILHAAEALARLILQFPVT